MTDGVRTWEVVSILVGERSRDEMALVRGATAHALADALRDRSRR